MSDRYELFIKPTLVLWKIYLEQISHLIFIRETFINELQNHLRLKEIFQTR